MKSFEFERWDAGRLIVNRDWAALYREHGLTTFDSLMSLERAEIAKNVLAERTTSRFALPDGSGHEVAFFIKRHGPPPAREYVKPWLRLTRPIIGAANEWQALISFHRAGIPTMLPVALGVAGRRSFLVTRSLDGCVKLSDWLVGRTHDAHGEGTRQKRRYVDRVADVARTMHRAGLHHQDFYLHHLMVPRNGGEEQVYVIDLGRVRQCRRLAQRWIVKDLAQLHFSTRQLTRSDQARFLHSYLGRPIQANDRRLIRRILRKSAAIGRHTRKHRL